MPRSRHSRWLSVAEKKKKISLRPPSVQDAASVFVIRVFASTKFHLLHRTYKKKSSFRETLSLFKKHFNIYHQKTGFLFFLRPSAVAIYKKKKTAAARASCIRWLLTDCVTYHQGKVSCCQHQRVKKKNTRRNSSGPLKKTVPD